MNGLELRDIHLPETGFWWPPAPGWWLLPALLLLLGIVALWLLRGRRQTALRRSSMRELQSIRRAREAGQDDRSTINAVARLLRRVSISHGGRAGQAATTGPAWLRQIERLAPRHRFSQQQLQLLAIDRYRADADCDIDDLLHACESWVRQLPRGSRRVSA